MGAGPAVPKGEMALMGALVHLKTDVARELTSSQAVV